MTSKDAQIFAHGTEIAEKKIRSARRMQSDVARHYVAALARFCLALWRQVTGQFNDAAKDWQRN
jgi:hypothetical protein